MLGILLNKLFPYKWEIRLKYIKYPEDEWAAVQNYRFKFQARNSLNFFLKYNGQNCLGFVCRIKK